MGDPGISPSPEAWKLTISDIKIFMELLNQLDHQIFLKKEQTETPVILSSYMVEGKCW